MPVLVVDTAGFTAGSMADDRQVERRPQPLDRHTGHRVARDDDGLGLLRHEESHQSQRRGLRCRWRAGPRTVRSRSRPHTPWSRRAARAGSRAAPTGRPRRSRRRRSDAGYRWAASCGGTGATSRSMARIPSSADVQAELVDVERDVRVAHLVRHLLRMRAHVGAARLGVIEGVLHRCPNGALDVRGERRSPDRRARRCPASGTGSPVSASHQSPRSIDLRQTMGLRR